MAQKTHLLHGATSDTLTANVNMFLTNNPNWVVTGGINYNGSYYYQGVINTSINYSVVLKFPATNGQTIFDLIDFTVDTSLSPSLFINGIRKNFGVDYTINNDAFTWTWINSGSPLTTGDLIQLEFTYL